MADMNSVKSAGALGKIIKKSQMHILLFIGQELGPKQILPQLLGSLLHNVEDGLMVQILSSFLFSQNGKKFSSQIMALSKR
jgi:hypothetical protein